jgi:hypothetical protein
MSTKKGDTNRESISTVGYGIVGVKNHGDKWDQKAYLMLVDFENGFASLKWETTRMINNIGIFGLYELEDIESKQENRNSQTSCLWTITRITM